MPIVDVASVRPVTAEPEDTVQEAIRRMLAARVGAVAVCEGTRLVGILTERDVLRLAGSGAPLDHLCVDRVMTRRLVTVAPDDDVLAVAQLMSRHRIRHVPVLQGDNLIGVVGIRDVLGVLAERLWRLHDADARETIQELLARLRVSAPS